MIRLISVLFGVGLIVVTVVYVCWQENADARRQRKLRGLDYVMKREIEESAVENHRQLTQTIGLLERILDADKVFPALSDAHRSEAVMAVRRFHRGLPGGDMREG